MRYPKRARPMVTTKPPTAKRAADTALGLLGLVVPVLDGGDDSRDDNLSRTQPGVHAALGEESRSHSDVRGDGSKFGFDGRP